MIKHLCITALSENKTSDQGLLAEHGLALYIEAAEQRILFDTGASTIFLKNAEKQGIDPAKSDTVILSHGHYDHTGGLKHLKNKTVYCHPDLFLPKYKASTTQEYAYIGNDYIRCFYEHNNALSFKTVSHTQELFSGFWLITGFKKDPAEKYFYKKISPQEYIPDDFSDELALAIQTAQGLVIITGCAHSGIINIIEKALSVTQGKKIHMLLGGFHLSKKTNREIQEVAKKLDEYAIDNIGISHCTGETLAQYLNCKNIFNFNTGEKAYA